MDQKIEKTIKALQNHGFAAEYAADRAGAKARLLELIPTGATVGVPGSRTVRETGIVEALKSRGEQVFDHWTAPAEDSLAVRKSQLACDVLLVSTNALTEAGELVNRDGIGNRVAAMVFGPRQVVVVAGRNKLVADLLAAEARIRRIAAPRRAKELNLQTPCVKAGECQDCNHAQRICRATVILLRRPSLTPIRVMVVGEDLGN
jgi:hypothetical protein